MVSEYSLEGLDERLNKHRQAIEALVELIPPKWYLPTDEDSMPVNSRYMKNTKNQAPKQAIKEATRKAKKAKLNPDNYKSVVQLEREELNGQDRKEGKQSDNDDEAAGPQRLPTIANPKERAASASELRARLHARIETLQSKRNISSKGEGRAALIEKRLKKKEERKKDRKEVKHRIAANEGGDELTTNIGRVTDSNDGGKKDVVAALSFGKIEYGDAAPKKRKGDTLGLLKSVEAKKRKLDEIKAKDADKHAAIMEKDAWSQLERKAEGDKIKDDPKLLKQTLKREQKRKQKSSEEWDERKSQVQKSQDDRQKKRAENIANRKASKKTGQKGKGSSKGKGKGTDSKKPRRPGFEGRAR
ncbi:hypothetical protein SmJEL517_g00747 [Synchytrium microbalum]|uniref:Ribosomal RNA-processing protein 14/surfeit locus protein 6 C-terminal domain-containing protein n=1 Tax=Synchytrium microbalum TaxID=1806994 RepID=A0A507CHE1_9FUNG|nr:uncharacterized protein SmJEL517_g00747 [Synchytrium microbalum]TPX37444.1 hypothetical protein SmJEL517_g00747 [Synchytrium microbalum]